jgi:hypothetical protein
MASLSVEFGSLRERLIDSLCVVFDFAQGAANFFASRISRWLSGAEAKGLEETDFQNYTRLTLRLRSGSG